MLLFIVVVKELPTNAYQMGSSSLNWHIFQQVHEAFPLALSSTLTRPSSNNSGDLVPNQPNQPNQRHRQNTTTMKIQKTSAKTAISNPPLQSRRLQVSVPISSLSHTNNNGLLKRGILSRILNFKKRVTVEATSHDRSDCVFFAAFPDVRQGKRASEVTSNKTRPCETHFLTVNPHTDIVPHLVSIEDEFELSFVGMHVPPCDSLPTNPNELLLYSLHNQVFPDNEGFVPQAMSTSSFSDSGHKEKEEERNSPVLDPNGIALQANDVPFIHYDPTMDNHGDGSTPDTFLPVPASKGVIRQHHANSPACIMPIRFSVMEIDKVTSEQAQGLLKVDSINGMLKQTNSTVPYIAIISSAISVANSVGKRALKKYAQPDHVLSKDMEFHLVPKSLAIEAATHERTPRDMHGHKNSTPQYAGAYLRVSN